MSILPKISSAVGVWPLAGRAAAGPPDFASRLAARMARTVSRVVMWRLHRKAVRQLGSLDDRPLRDIGIPRDCIEAAVRLGRRATRSKLFPR